MKKLYLTYVLLTLLVPLTLPAQNCVTLNATFTSYDSRCAATGAIKVTTTGGSGSYKYRVSGPVNLNFTTIDSITGLPAGMYNIEVVDINSGCQFFGTSIQVGGNYGDPRFLLQSTDVSCLNGSNGSIEIVDEVNGRQPFIYTIVAPSVMGVGMTPTNGVFAGLKAGSYTIQLRDSCGGIQTRTAYIENYSWSIEGHTIVRTSCDEASGLIKVKDSKGRFGYSGSGIPGMTYGILKAVGDTIWSSDPNFTFDATGKTSTKAFAKDNCGNLKSVSVSLPLSPSISSTIKVDQKTCSTFRASVQSIKNMFTPIYRLLDSDDQLITVNSTGVFPGLAYGSYKIEAIDGCTGIKLTRTVSAAAAVVSINANATIETRTCNTFTARFTGQKNTTSPTYRIYDENNVLVSTNTNGRFLLLPYGKYRMEMQDGCVDTTIIRNIDVERLIPEVDSLTAAYIRCEVFGLNITGKNIYSKAQYCLYDNMGTLVACNNTGKFDNIPLGNYCVQIHDLCSDTILNRCISVTQPVLQNDLSVKQVKSCSTFTVITTTANFSGGTFYLYNNNDELVAQNGTGTFSDLPYGQYTVSAKAVCPDTTVSVSINSEPVKPTGKAALTASNLRCDKIDIQVTGVSNLSSPVYTFKNNLGQVVYKGSSPKVTNLPYGNYCVDVENNCYDTTISVCGNFVAADFSGFAEFSKSCEYGFSNVKVRASIYPATVLVMSPSNVMVASKVITKEETIENIPGLADGQKYTIKYQTSCGTEATVTAAPVVTYFNHSATLEEFCPGSVWTNGFGNITLDVTTNSGNVTVGIIKKNNSNFTMAPTSIIDDQYKFAELEPATYIIRSVSNDGCNKEFFDTVTINPYQYPNMGNTTAYQCDNEGFSVSAAVSHGVGPFTYEIMSSTPDLPSIATAPQSSPVFNIDNGIEYQLIRLRAIDACGNATLGDASILPLASNKISGTTDHCIGSRITLSVDTMINSEVTWSYKKKISDAEETVLGDGFSFNINPLTYADTGVYFSHISMNNGCVTRTYEFNVNGVCYGVLSSDVQVDLKGKMKEGKSLLNWEVKNDQGLKSIVIERGEGNNFSQIGTLQATEFVLPGKYQFTDDRPNTENNYRVKLVFEGGATVYSKIVHLNMPSVAAVNVFPNPATNFVTVSFNNYDNNNWQVELINMAGQKTVRKDNVNGQKHTIQRTSAMPSGMYLLKVTNQKTGDAENYKVLFK